MTSPSKARPLSPHLSVYRWRANMTVSILHRATGVGLATGGALLLLIWLWAAVLGPQSYELFLALAVGPLGQGLLIALTWGVFQHMMSGIRHLCMDTGAGYDPARSRWTATLTFLASFTLTALVWALVWFL